MKPVDPKRFQQRRPEDIPFQGAPIPDKPSTNHISAKESDRPTDRSKISEVLTQVPNNILEQQAQSITYFIKIPEQRRIERHSFDVFEDQLEALKKLQLATQEETRSKGVPTLGDMVREALDRHIKERVKQLPNIQFGP